MVTVITLSFLETGGVYYLVDQGEPEPKGPASGVLDRRQPVLVLEATADAA